MRSIKELTESSLYKKFISQQGVKNLVFEQHLIIDEPQSADVWVLYGPENSLVQSYSLNNLLWE